MGLQYVYGNLVSYDPNGVLVRPVGHLSSHYSGCTLRNDLQTTEQMKLRIQDAQGKYILLDSLYPLKSHTNAKGELELFCVEWIVTEFNKPMYESIMGTINNKTNQE